MTRKEIISFLSKNGVIKSNDNTILNTYSDNPNLSSIIKAIGGNRLQSGWKTAQYVIAKYSKLESGQSIEDIVKGWKAVVEDYQDQYLFVEERPNEWKVYNAEGQEITLDKIQFQKQTKKTAKIHQIIFYGAPGTGKSNTIKRDVEDKGKIHFRTTFHPDSDYSTFVGCYKPSMDKPKQNIKLNLSFDDLAEELKQYYNDQSLGNIKGIQKFCLDYNKYIDGEYQKINVNELVKKAGISDNYAGEIRKYIGFYKLIPKQEDKRIIYAFTPQAFTNAYIAAWRTTEDVYLIIEEINRGNCAQIFGDLFQLLDRKNGFSEYPIVPDTDLGNYIAEKLIDSPRTEGWRDGVKEGKKLVLPNNLYIWATMNTSDQSLFPIDSAFKRRWEWKYMPIMPHHEIGYSIEIGSVKYDWWGFLNKINNVIGETTSSEDKKMGYFFVTPADKKVTAEQFVGKVLFYLWNDVFKNYGFDNTIFNKGDKKHFVFSDFFLVDGSPNTENVNKFLRKLDETIDKEHPFEIKKAKQEENPGEESADSEEKTSETPEAEA